MDDFQSGTRTVIARCVSAEVRAVMGVRKLALRPVADGAGLTSHNYLTIRLNDKKPFTLDDIEKLVTYFDDAGMTVEKFIEVAVRNHRSRLIVLATVEAMDLEERGLEASPSSRELFERYAEIHREVAARYRNGGERRHAEVSDPAPTLRAVAKEGMIEEYDED